MGHVRNNIRIGVSKAPTLDHPLACVIGGCNQPKVALKLAHQVGEMTNSTGNVLPDIAAVLNAESSCRIGHELH